MANIEHITAREILDSRGNPTVEVDVTLDDGSFGRASVPSGASTGIHEVLELRDGGSRYGGKGVLRAVENVKTEIANHVKGMNALDQETLDREMITLDGTKNKSRLGANALLGVSMAVLRAAANSSSLMLYEYVGKVFGVNSFSMPQVMFNVLNGGRHASFATDVQEYFIIPKKDQFSSFAESLRAGAEIYHTLKKILKEKGYTTSVGDEGGFAPKEISSNTEPVDLLLRAIEKAGYVSGKEIVLGFDAAASEFYEDGKYLLRKEGLKLDSRSWADMIKKWCDQYPIFSLEDMHAEDDIEGWQYMMELIGNDHQIVGDDLLVTNTDRIKMAIEKKAANSLLVKVNQIGTIWEAFEAIKMTKKVGWTNVFSHRSGETEDSIIADLVVGTGTHQIKTGAPSRGERTSKYNQLLRIEEVI